MHNAMTAAFLAYPTETFSNALLVSLMVPSVLWLWWRTETESATAWDPARTQTGNGGTQGVSKKMSFLGKIAITTGPFTNDVATLNNQ